MCEVMVVRFAVAIILKNRRFYRTFRHIARVFSAICIKFYDFWLSAASTGVRHSSSPEVSYETFLALVVSKSQNG
jgi:hypothetical protein